jgi:hypothetical protein
MHVLLIVILFCYVVVAIVVDLEQHLEPPKFIIKKQKYEFQK